MKRFDKKLGERVETPEIDAFLSEIVEVCRKHNLSISHEDHHGGFLIQQYSDDLVEWLEDASKDT